MDTLRRLYTIVVQNIRKAREKLPKKEEEPHKFKVNDMVLVKDPDAAVFKPRYQPNLRVTAIFGNNRIEVQDERGHKSVRRSAHVKYIAPSEKVVKQLPSEQVLKNYGRSSKLLLAVKDIPDLHFDVMNVKEKKKNIRGNRRDGNRERGHKRKRAEQRFPRTFKKFAGKCSRWSTTLNKSTRKRREEDRSKAAQGNQRIQRTLSRIAE